MSRLVASTLALLAGAAFAQAAPDAAAPGEGPHAAAVRQAAAGPGTPAERAARVRALGRDALTALVAEPALEPLADELFALAVAGLDDGELRAAAIAWVGEDGRPFGRALVRLGDGPPRAALAEPLLRYVALDPDDAALEGRAEGVLDAIVDRDGLDPIRAALPREPPAPPRIRAAAAAALRRSGRPEAVVPLLALAGDDEPRVAQAAVAALGLVVDGTDLQVPFLIALVSDPSARTPLRRAAIQSLGRLRASDAAPALLATLESDADAARPVRSDVHWALQEIAAKKLPLDPAACRAHFDESAERAARELPLLVAEVESGEPAVVLRGLRRLAGLEAARPRVRAALLPLLRSPNPGLRAAACAGLGQVRDPGALSHLIVALEDPDPGVHDAAYNALKFITGRNLPPQPATWRRRNR